MGEPRHYGPGSRPFVHPPAGSELAYLCARLDTEIGKPIGMANYMGAFVRNIDVIRAATEAHVMVIHHSGKDQARGARGHSLLRAATDTEIEVKRIERDDGPVGGVLTVTKQRDMEGEFRRAFTLRSVPLGFGRNGKPVTSAIACLEGEDASRPVLKGPTTAEQEVLSGSARTGQ